MPTASAQDLFAAIASNDRAAVQRLVEADPNLAAATDAQGLRPFLLALYRGQPDLAQHLLHLVPPEHVSVSEAAAVGATDRLRTILQRDPAAATTWAPDGFTPLALAAFFGRTEAVQVLLAHGADVNAAARNTARVTALHAALAGPEPQLARVLVQAGADVMARQQGDNTPLHSAAANGLLDLCQLLLEAGADPRATNAQGQTPIDLARHHGHPELADYLSA